MDLKKNKRKNTQLFLIVLYFRYKNRCVYLFYNVKKYLLCNYIIKISYRENKTYLKKKYPIKSLSYKVKLGANIWGV